MALSLGGGGGVWVGAARIARPESGTHGLEIAQHTRQVRVANLVRAPAVVSVVDRAVGVTPDLVLTLVRFHRRLHRVRFDGVMLDVRSDRRLKKTLGFACVCLRCRRWPLPPVCG